MYEHCEVEVVENVLPEENFKALEEFVLSPKFAWHWEPRNNSVVVNENIRYSTNGHTDLYRR